MAEHRTHKSKLYATAEQETLFAQFAGVCRLIYNTALEQRRDFYRQHKAVTGSNISRFGQERELTLLRAEIDWIEAVPRSCTANALADLDKAYEDFFAKRRGYPSMRRKGANDSFRFPGRDCEVRSTIVSRFAEVRIPKIGWVRFRISRQLPEGYRLVSVTVKRDANGWHVCTAIAQPATVVAAPEEGSIGIDRGVANTLALSDGTFASQPLAALRILTRRAKGHQRRLCRQRKGSNRRAVTRSLLAKTQAKIARVRKHWNHVQTSRLVKAHAVIAVEALNIRNMTKSAKGTLDEPGTNVVAKAGLNRSILNHNWGQFGEFLTYKAEAAGAQIIQVDPIYTSQHCYACGNISKDNRKNQAVFECMDCGYAAHADTNAAMNIQLAGTRPASRGCLPSLKREEKTFERVA